jgi:uroporphyrinogen decarboxylase
MTSRERFLDILDFKPADPLWVRCALYLWDETIERWREEGWDGTPLETYFGVDNIMRVDPYYGPVPPFAHEVMSEDETTVVYVNHEGILMREFKMNRDMSMPQFIKFPVENEGEWRTFVAERLALHPAERLDPEWQAKVAPYRNAPGGSGAPAGIDPPPRQCWADRWGGFFGSIRNMLGVERLCTAFYDDPAWVERMMGERADAMIAVTEEVLKYTDIDLFFFWEDMAYKAGPLVGPKMYRKFALKHYRRVCDWVHSKGIRHIGLDSDGDISLLIPIWLDAGIDVLWPFEVQAGMDVLKVRQQFGRDLVIWGGIDKRAIAEGGEAMRCEVERVMPLVEEGGYIPEPDHGIPPDISWPNFCEYMEYLKFRLGRG